MEAIRKKRVFPRRSRWLVALLVVFLIGLIIYVFRTPILVGFSSYLNNADPVEEVDALVVLGGSPLDRGFRGAEIFNEGLVKGNVYCTGGYIIDALEAFKIDVKESGLTKNVVIGHGVPEERVIELQQSTSTWEEAHEVRELLKNKEWKKVGIISSEYHIRRVRWTFDEVFKDSEQQVDLLFFDSDSDRYNAPEWWKDEESFLTTYGEYTKLLFYLIKY